MIRQVGQAFYLHGKNSSYAFCINEAGLPEHLYYGAKIRETEESAGLQEKTEFVPGNLISYGKEYPKIALENLSLEVSYFGKGDVREVFLEVENEEGVRGCDFHYHSARISKGKPKMKSLPNSYGDEHQVETLEVTLKDNFLNAMLILSYSLFEEIDVLTKSARLVNLGKKRMTIRKFMSSQVDFPANSYKIHHFSGAWAREMEKKEVLLNGGGFVLGSTQGSTGSRNNSFVMFTDEETTEEWGNSYGFHLIYSGNHYESFTTNAYGKVRFLQGIHPTGFSWELSEGETFESPEAVMTFSAQGFNGMSRNFHPFIQEHIVRGEWKKKVRPILINSWESFYFQFTEGKLLKLAKKAMDLGIELFVLDDGWFGKRDHDGCSLGDWKVNREKLPSGIDGLAKQINTLGLDFGIWVEPEMVNEDSDLYREHPDWVLKHPFGTQALGRNQMVLDLSRSEVQEHLIEEMSRLFSSANISYVKWDMNRIFSEVYSVGVDAHRQGEVPHRYILGLYRVLEVLTQRFPKILFEACAAGGNRFDLGMLCYMPQIWASDDTDAAMRRRIQEGYSYGYPLSVVTAHVSGTPNHQTLREISLETRFHIAMFGILGYECNLNELTKTEQEEIREQIRIYKQWREVLQFGDFYRIRRKDLQNVASWITVSTDRKNAVGMLMQDQVIPNRPHWSFRARGLKPNALYHLQGRSLRYDVRIFGDLINTIAPIHIKKNSLIHRTVAHFVKLDGEKEEARMYGSTLENAGYCLKQGFIGMGYNEEVRLVTDYSSRIYFLEEVDHEEESHTRRDQC